MSVSRAGRPWRRTLGNGLREERGWDTRGRLSSFALKSAAGSTLRSESWGYSARSDVLSHTVDGGATAFTYDDEGQLLSESRTGYATSYTYDGNGNRKTRVVNGTTETYTFDAGDKLESIAYSGGGSRSFTYDLAGRMLTDSLNSRAFSWTADSRLASLTATTGNESYTYSAFGTRAKVGTRTFLRAGAGVTAIVLDDGNAEYTPGVSELRSGTTTFSHSGLKSMGAQTDAGATPAVLATRTYDAFGATQSTSGTWNGPFGYAGAFGYQTEPSALHLLGHRYFDGSLGRFVTRDPIGDGSNWYAYCENDPLALADPAGTLALQIAATIVLNDLDPDWNPRPPPGVDVDANRELARNMTGVIYLEHLVFPPHFDPGEYYVKKMSWFRNMVTDGGPWDYKGHGGSEAFGNWHYGVVAHDFELSKPIALRAAGWNQMGKRWVYHRENGNWWGEPPYGDDPVDQFWIDRGFEYAKRTWYDVGK